MGKTSKEILEERICELQRIAEANQNFCSVIEECKCLTTTQKKRLIGVYLRTDKYLANEFTKCTESLTKKKEPSKGAMLNTLKNSLGEDELKALLEEKGITL